MILGDLTSVTLATNPDGDEDGTPGDEDGEPQNPCVPEQSAPSCDQDSDGLTNKDEANIGTDPTKPDSDGDNDGAEMDTGSDPMNPCSPTPDEDHCNGDDDSDDNDDGDNDDGGGGSGNEDVDDDGDGVGNDDDSKPNDPCVPNQNHPCCEGSEIPNSPDAFLYLPSGSGDSE